MTFCKMQSCQRAQWKPSAREGAKHCRRKTATKAAGSSTMSMTMSSNRVFVLAVTCFATLPKTRRKKHPEREFVPVQGLNLNELHENVMDLLYPRRTVWMFVIKVLINF